MISNFNLYLFSICIVLLSACSPEEEIQKVTITNITPGTTVLGGNTLNTAMIGDTMTITGENFSTVASENRVSVHGVPSTVIRASNTVIKAKIPTGVPFSYVDVIVARTGFQEAVSPISIRATPSPVITGISPTSGPIGTIVTIYGKNLEETLEANMIMFTPEIVIKPFKPIVATPDSLQVQIPSGAGTGAINLYAKPAQNVENSFFSIVTPVFTITP